MPLLSDVAFCRACEADMVGRRTTQGHEYRAFDDVDKDEREEDVEKLEMSVSSIAERRWPGCQIRRWVVRRLG